MRWLIKIIKEAIIYFKCIISGAIFNEILDLSIKQEDRKIFVYLGAFYQNIGDMAITYAHEKFLKDNFPEYKIIVVPSNATYSTYRWVKKIINPTDVITIVGGGNMDSEYSSLENCRRFIVKKFRNNKIISFPQTIHFKDDFYGNYRLHKSLSIYNRHKNIYLCAREEFSYKKMKTLFVNAKGIYLIPDMVLSLDFTKDYNFQRRGALCVLRNDLEKTNNYKEKEVYNILNKHFSEVSDTDTVSVDINDCKPNTYKNTVLSFLQKIASKELVITDRLHCMIFCVITGTPCISFDNSNKKISGVYYSWLSNLNYISYMENYNKNDFEKLVKRYVNFDLKKNKFEYGYKYSELKNVIKVGGKCE